MKISFLRTIPLVCCLSCQPEVLPEDPFDLTGSYFLSVTETENTCSGKPGGYLGTVLAKFDQDTSRRTTLLFATTEISVVMMESNKGYLLSSDWDDCYNKNSSGYFTCHEADASVSVLAYLRQDVPIYDGSLARFLDLDFRVGFNSGCGKDLKQAGSTRWESEGYSQVDPYIQHCRTGSLWCYFDKQCKYKSFGCVNNFHLCPNGKSYREIKEGGSDGPCQVVN